VLELTVYVTRLRERTVDFAGLRLTPARPVRDADFVATRFELLEDFVAARRLVAELAFRVVFAPPFFADDALGLARLLFG
jgi:hypothetical protein